MATTSSRFVWRTFTSVFLGAAFLVAVISGAVLFLAPPGRIANWTDWTILGLTKHEWSAVHISFTLAFLVMAILHVIFNWRPLVSYFKNRMTRRVGFRYEWATALVLTLLMGWGTLAVAPPFSWVLALNENLKAIWDKPAQRAPMPHAELLALGELADQAGVPWEMAAARLEQAGMENVSSNSVVEVLARANNVSAQRIYDLIRPAEPAGTHGGSGGGRGAGGGMGWKTLTEFCATEGISVTAAVDRLRANGLQASPDQTLREIAANNGLDRPAELLQILRDPNRQPGN